MEHLIDARKTTSKTQDTKEQSKETSTTAELKVGVLASTPLTVPLRAVVQELRGRPDVAVELFSDSERFFSSKATLPDWDACLVWGNSPVIEAQAYAVKRAGVPTFNTPMSVFLATHRVMTGALVRAAGIPEPEFVVTREDDGGYRNYESLDYRRKITPPGSEVRGATPASRKSRKRRKKGEKGRLRYYRRDLGGKDGKYRVVALGSELFFTNLDGTTHPPLEEYARRVLSEVGLVIATLDFIRRGSTFYFYELSPIPDIDSVEGGAKVLADFLLEKGSQFRERGGADD
ncbi:MAG: hypothetical protein ACTSU5_08520 [Promethearchaeota archaeon]